MYQIFSSFTSSKSNIDYGVPQGSMFDPMFIIYIGEIVKHIKKCSVHLYADETVIYLSHRNVLNFRVRIKF